MYTNEEKKDGLSVLTGFLYVKTALIKTSGNTIKSHAASLFVRIFLVMTRIFFL
jgi:hypothetical protein